MSKRNPIPVQCCATCALFDLDATRDKAGRIRKDWAAKCLWVSAEVYPESVYRYADRPQALYMKPRFGITCKAWKPRAPGAS